MEQKFVMETTIYDTKLELGKAAADRGADYIRKAIAEKGHANIIVATAASQFELQDALVLEKDIDWSKVSIFHLDEYLGLPEDHPASFRFNLRKMLINRLPCPPAEFFPVNGNTNDVKALVEDFRTKLDERPVDVAFIGIGENGHIAFNDPPADFQAKDPFLVIKLDEVCRHQQLGEGWFPTMDDVPKYALSMSVPQIMKSKAIICVVPDDRKAKAVKAALEGPITNMCPSSILRTHHDCHMYLDKPAASLLIK